MSLNFVGDVCRLCLSKCDTMAIPVTQDSIQNRKIQECLSINVSKQSTLRFIKWPDS